MPFRNVVKLDFAIWGTSPHLTEGLPPPITKSNLMERFYKLKLWKYKNIFLVKIGKSLMINSSFHQTMNFHGREQIYCWIDWTPTQKKQMISLWQVCQFCVTGWNFVWLSKNREIKWKSGHLYVQLWDAPLISVQSIIDWLLSPMHNV